MFRFIPVAFLVLLGLSAPAWAYVDPGIAGAVFQVGYLLFYGFLALLAFFFRPIKLMYLAFKNRLFPQRPAAQGQDAVSDGEGAGEEAVPTETAADAEALRERDDTCATHPQE